MRTLRVLSTLGLAAGLMLLLNSGYLAARAEPTLVYLSNVALHTAAGGLLFPLRLLRTWPLRQWCQAMAPHRSTSLATAGFWCLAIGLLAGIGIIVLGNYRPQRWLLYTHIGLCSAAVALLLLALASPQARHGLVLWQRYAWRMALLITGTSLLFPGLFVVLRASQPDLYRVANPELPPLSQDEEGMYGEAGPFHPAGLFTNTGGKIPSNFFMTSQRCADCHPDIYRQWSESAHRFSSFNNQWYRKSIEYMQDVIGTRPSRWCAGCHDVALLLNGMMDTPVRQLLDTPEAHVGLACTPAHAFTRVRYTMANGDYLIAYPALHDLMASDDRFVHLLHDFLVRVAPEPHRQVFLKPFHRNAQSPEFCSACHK